MTYLTFTKHAVQATHSEPTTFLLLPPTATTQPHSPNPNHNRMATLTYHSPVTRARLFGRWELGLYDPPLPVRYRYEMRVLDARCGAVYMLSVCVVWLDLKPPFSVEDGDAEVDML